jgi:hypothetical protein
LTPANSVKITSSTSAMAKMSKPSINPPKAEREGALKARHDLSAHRLRRFSRLFMKYS